MDDEVNFSSPSINAISSIQDVLADYGWYMLFSVVVSLYLYDKYFRSVIKSYKEHKDEAEYAAKYHKNPDLLSDRLKAQERRTRELQEKYQRDLEEHKRKLAEKEEKKKNELIELYEKGGHTLGSSSTGSKSFKPEYNPLMGSGSSSNYKPPKRSKCGKGGCG